MLLSLILVPNAIVFGFLYVLFMEAEIERARIADTRSCHHVGA